LKTELQITAEAYNKALEETREREWKEGDLACHPGEEVIFRIDRFARGYAIADIEDPYTGNIVTTKRFPLEEITDPKLVLKFMREIFTIDRMKAMNKFN
jgi:hypothetical protein